MSPSEVYFWTALPRISGHLYGTAGLSAVGLALFGAIGGLSVAEGNLDRKVYSRIMFALFISIGFFAWAGTFVPDEKQVEQIVRGQLK